MKRHGATADWLTKSTEFTNWMSDPNSSMLVLSGKREFFSQAYALFIAYNALSWVWQDRNSVRSPLYSIRKVNPR